MMGLGYKLTPVNVANLDLFSDSIISPFGADDEPERGTYRARIRPIMERVLKSSLRSRQCPPSWRTLTIGGLSRTRICRDFWQDVETAQ